MDEEFDDFPPMEVEITDVLDLHTFAPRDVADLVNSYIDECISRGFPQVRIIHGKGTGTLRRIVHAALDRHAGVERFVLAGEAAGGWGATIAWLRSS
jgi:dsDNA-specific endonuclease/ATPase MutS2